MVLLVGKKKRWEKKEKGKKARKKKHDADQRCGYGPVAEPYIYWLWGSVYGSLVIPAEGLRL